MRSTASWYYPYPLFYWLPSCWWRFWHGSLRLWSCAASARLPRLLLRRRMRPQRLAAPPAAQALLERTAAAQVAAALPAVSTATEAAPAAGAVLTLAAEEDRLLAVFAAAVHAVFGERARRSCPCGRPAGLGTGRAPRITSTACVSRSAHHSSIPTITAHPLKP